MPTIEFNSYQDVIDETRRVVNVPKFVHIGLLASAATRRFERSLVQYHADAIEGSLDAVECSQVRVYRMVYEKAWIDLTRKQRDERPTLATLVALLKHPDAKKYRFRTVYNQHAESEAYRQRFRTYCSTVHAAAGMNGNVIRCLTDVSLENTYRASGELRDRAREERKRRADAARKRRSRKTRAA